MFCTVAVRAVVHVPLSRFKKKNTYSVCAVVVPPSKNTYSVCTVAVHAVVYAPLRRLNKYKYSVRVVVVHTPPEKVKVCQ